VTKRGGGPRVATARFPALKHDSCVADNPNGVKASPKRMTLRPHFTSTRSASRLILLALALLLLGRAPNDAAAGLSDYSSTLYLSGATSGLLSGSDTLVTAAGPGQPTGALSLTVTVPVPGPGLLSGTYSYA